jgi:hypothetical protein
MILRATLVHYCKQKIFPNQGIYSDKTLRICLFKDFEKYFKPASGLHWQLRNF